MGVYRLRCDIEFPANSEGLAASVRIADLLMDAGGSAGCINLHLCRHQDHPAGSCDPYLLDTIWGGDESA